MQENSSSPNKNLGIFQQIRALYKSIIKHDGQGILVPLFGIILIGFLNGYSATYTTTLHGGDNWKPFWLLLGKQALFLGVGFFVAWWFYRFDYRKWGDPRTTFHNLLILDITKAHAFQSQRKRLYCPH